MSVKRKPLTHFPSAGGFTLRRITDLIDLDRSGSQDFSDAQKLEDFRNNLQAYLHVKGRTARNAALKYMIEDCRNLVNKKNSPAKEEILHRIQKMLEELYNQ